MRQAPGWRYLEKRREMQTPRCGAACERGLCHQRGLGERTEAQARRLLAEDRELSTASRPNPFDLCGGRSEHKERSSKDVTAS